MKPPTQLEFPSHQTSSADANERLAQSRERLRQALRLRANTQHGLDASAAALGAAGHETAVAASRTLGLPKVAQALLDAWSQHPLRAAITLGGCATKALLQPVARKHPMALMVAALVVGASVAYFRPWRWKLKPAYWAGLLPQLTYKTLTRIPLTTWWTVLASLNDRSAAPTDDSTSKAR